MSKKETPRLEQDCTESTSTGVDGDKMPTRVSGLDRLVT